MELFKPNNFFLKHLENFKANIKINKAHFFEASANQKKEREKSQLFGAFLSLGMENRRNTLLLGK